jgi:hypothetical protein
MKSLAIIESDPWLAPYTDAIVGRYEYFGVLRKN